LGQYCVSIVPPLLFISEKYGLYYEGKAFTSNKNGRKGNGKAGMGELGGDYKFETGSGLTEMGNRESEPVNRV
jgi:hypothetical protein